MDRGERQVVRRLRRALAVVIALCLWHSAAWAQSLPPGSWSASSTAGLRLAGTYTATVDSVSGAVTGEWVLLDVQGREAARGAWSAAKGRGSWSGAWRSVAAGDSREWSGTFTAAMQPTADAKLSDLFTQAISAVVRGTWRTGPSAGAWAVRASP